MHLEELRAMRTNWYEAYVAGDTERMGALEDPSFFVMSEAGIETRAEQLDGIAAAVRAGRWFPVGSRAEDLHLELRAAGQDLASAHGRGRIATPRGNLLAVLFTELWRRGPQGWSALHLHYQNARPRG